MRLGGTTSLAKGDGAECVKNVARAKAVGRSNGGQGEGLECAVADSPLLVSLDVLPTLHTLAAVEADKASADGVRYTVGAVG